MFNGENKTKKGEKREKKNQFPKIPNWILFFFLFLHFRSQRGEREIDDFASKSCWILDVVKGSLFLLFFLHPFTESCWLCERAGPVEKENVGGDFETQLIGMSSALQTSLSTSVQLPTPAFAVTPTYQMDLWPLSIVQVTIKLYSHWRSTLWYWL